VGRAKKRDAMRSTITIHPKFNFLTPYIEKIPLTFESLPNVLYRDRNVIKTDQVSNVKLVIKSYGRIYLTNRIRYSFFYPSKAERAYQNGLRLLDAGFLTPEPVAFIECSKGGLLKESYFISLHSDFTPMASIISDEPDLPIKDLVGFAHQLHRHGIYHMDFSAGNILCKKEDGHFQFALVDNNRMEFRKFNYAKGLKTFKRLGLDKVQLTYVAKEYARLEKENEIRTIQQILDIVRRHQQLDRLRKQAKQMVINAGHRLVATLS
jgi:hypothetical protein